MPLPNIFLGILFSTLFGAAFHLWRGGGPGRLLFYLILSWIGFWTGHVLGETLGFTLGSLGPLRFLAATIGSFLLLAFGYWLSLMERGGQ